MKRRVTIEIDLDDSQGKDAMVLAFAERYKAVNRTLEREVFGDNSLGEDCEFKVPRVVDGNAGAWSIRIEELHQVRHFKRGGVYDRIDMATVQTETPLLDNHKVIVYRDRATFALYVRSVGEYADPNRFVEA